MINRSDDSVLVLSQDYELFFQKSGSIEKCLLEPSAMLMDFAKQHGIRLTFFVDTGMLLCIDRHANEHAALAGAAARIREQLQAISAAGHELALHVHPHWEDSRYVDGEWDFSATRYRLDAFSDDEVERILRSNFQVLQELSSSAVVSYRAGGFCIEPFSRIAATLMDLGVTVESSIVAGAKLVDAEKGFDFSSLSDRPWWFFDQSPILPRQSGAFLEVPVTPYTVSRSFYWGRLIDRLNSGEGSKKPGDGISKAIGRAEILRRLAGLSRISELSTDDAKSPYLASANVLARRRRLWHLMGHPKLLSRRSLEFLAAFIHTKGINRATTLATLAEEIRQRGHG